MTLDEAEAAVTTFFDDAIEDELQRAETLLVELGATPAELAAALRLHHGHLLATKRQALAGLRDHLRTAFVH